MAVIVDGNEIVLTGTVGAYWFEDGFTAADVSGALAQVGRDTDIVVRLNSGGGIATEGTAIHSAFAAHKGRVEMVVEGIAASAGSIIAMAGAKLTMALGAVLMIHDAATIAFGNSEEMAKAGRELEAISNSYAAIYADRTGKPLAEMRALMKPETWFTAEEAVAAGLAHGVGTGPTEDRGEPSAFAYRAYANAPAPVLALADARGWTLQKLKAASAGASTAKPGPVASGDTGQADPVASAVAADRARRAAIMALDEAKGREALAEHFYMTGSTVDAAKAALAAAPVASGSDRSADLEAAYDRERALAVSAAGLSSPMTIETDAARSAWKHASERINAFKERG